MNTEQLNIEGKRSGEGFICHRERLVSALARAQADKVEIINTTLGRKGFLNYLRLLGGSNVVKVIPSNGSASGSQAIAKSLKVICGANTSYLPDEAWITEKNRFGSHCQVRVSPRNTVKPNLGGIELAEALARVIPFTPKGKDAESRPVLACIRFAQKDGKLTLTGADGFRLAEVALDFEEGEGEALIEASEVKGLIPALKKAKRVKVSLEAGGEKLDSKSLVIDTELICYKWHSQDGSYPDYEKVIPTEFVAEARFDTREMLKATQSLGALWLDKESLIKLTVGDGKVALEVKEERGKAEVEAEISGEAKIGVNAKYLAQALKSLGGMAELKLVSPTSPMLFSVDGYRLLVMPMVVAESKTVAEAEAVAKDAEAKTEVVAETEGEAEEKPKRKRKDKEPVAVA